VVHPLLMHADSIPTNQTINDETTTTTTNCTAVWVFFVQLLGKCMPGASFSGGFMHDTDFIPTNKTINNDETTRTNCDDVVWEYFVQLRGKLLVYNLFGTAHVCWFYSCQPMEQKHQELTALLWVDFLFIILCKLLQEQGERYRKTILVGFLPTKNMKQHKEELPCYTVWDFVVKFLCRLLEVTCCIER
jgi:hypothetical protein